MQIELRKVCKVFGQATALRDVSLTIPSGRKVGLIGPNGSGKSTLTRVVMGLLSCQGTVLLDGQAPFERRVELARRLAYVPQIAPQLGAAVGEVLRAVALLRDLPLRHIEDLCAALALDLGALRDRPFRNLSGGMKQKLMIALALATSAPLLILDEPTASLDARSRDRFFELYAEHAGEATLILCSHRLEEVRHLVDHVIVLQEGVVAYDGPAQEYLDRRALSVIEISVVAGTHDDWMEARGFRPGTTSAGSFARTVNQGEKLRLIGELTMALGAELTNLVVRDLEAIDLHPQGGADD